MSPSWINDRLAYAWRLAAAGLPIIYDGSHLCALLGIDEAGLLRALDVPASLYITYFIPKRRVGFRRIDQPVPTLMGIQRWLLRHVLDRCHPHDAAMAFRRGRSIKANAGLHVGQAKILSLDVKDFFPSIGAGHISQVFLRLGYAETVTDLLTRLTVFEGGLPQGSPTSPMLSNLVMQGVDEALARFAVERGLSYSRYADDLTFSGGLRAGEVIGMVRWVLGRFGLSLNEAKTRLMLRHQRQEVTGVVVNERLQSPREVRRTVRQEIHYIRRFGLEEHIAKRPSFYEGRVEHLRGVAEFILFLNPEDRDASSAIETLGRVRFGALQTKRSRSEEA